MDKDWRTETYEAADVIEERARVKAMEESDRVDAELVKALETYLGSLYGEQRWGAEVFDLLADICPDSPVVRATEEADK